MYGAIIGNIVGSQFLGRYNEHKSKKFDMFSERCHFTGDTVMTLAICKALLECEDGFSNLREKAIYYMQEFGKNYEDRGYGKSFMNWMRSEFPQPYYSYGNGGAMRVSGCAYAGQNLEEVKRLSHTVTEITHNNPEGIAGAEAVATATFLASERQSKEDIRKYIDENYYKMNFTLDEIRPTYRFSNRSSESVPQALMAFFESVDFEDAIRNAISIGGDSDTIAAITGSVAEPYYGIPVHMREQAVQYLDDQLLEIINQFEEKYPRGNDIFEYYSGRAETKMKENKIMKIFISHATEDEKAASELVGLLRKMGLAESNIFCSSTPGTGIPLGVDICEYLKDLFEKCDLHVIFIHSPNYYNSVYSMNEMGVAWCLQKEITSILLPGFEFSDMKGVVNNKQIAIKMDSKTVEVKDKLNQLRDTIIKEFDLEKGKDITWETDRDNFINTILKLPI